MTTPENMIERVARAIFSQYPLRSAPYNDALMIWERDASENDKYACMAQARAAIAAMREPTPEMIEVGRSVAVKPPDWMSLKPFGDGPYVHKSFMSPEHTAAHFTAMIEQALKEQP